MCIQYSCPAMIKVAVKCKMIVMDIYTVSFSRRLIPIAKQIASRPCYNTIVPVISNSLWPEL